MRLSPLPVFWTARLQWRRYLLLPAFPAVLHLHVTAIHCLVVLCGVGCVCVRVDGWVRVCVCVRACLRVGGWVACSEACFLLLLNSHGLLAFAVFTRFCRDTQTRGPAENTRWSKVASIFSHASFAKGDSC